MKPWGLVAVIVGGLSFSTFMTAVPKAGPLGGALSLLFLIGLPLGLYWLRRAGVLGAQSADPPRPQRRRAGRRPPDVDYPHDKSDMLVGCTAVMIAVLSVVAIGGAGLALFYKRQADDLRARSEASTSAAQGQLAEENERVRDLTRTNSDLRRKGVRLRQELNAARKENNALQARRQQLTKQCDTLSEQNAELQRRSEALEQALKKTDEFAGLDPFNRRYHEQLEREIATVVNEARAKSKTAPEVAVLDLALTLNALSRAPNLQPVFRERLSGKIVLEMKAISSTIDSNRLTARYPR